ncbi:MAG: hypothetical protein AB7G52_15100 [Arcobacter sp.]
MLKIVLLILNSIRDIINKSNSVFKKDSENRIKCCHDGINVISRTRDEIMESMDYSTYKDPVIINKDNDKTLLILDDINVSMALYESDFNRIKRTYSKDIKNDFKVVNVIGTTAGFMAHKYIVVNNNKIDYAILDITLGYIVKLNNGEYLEFDGIDIAIDILKSNQGAKFLFSTAHTLNRRNPTMEYYFSKFETATGLNIEDYYLNKNTDRAEKIYHMLYEE